MIAQRADFNTQKGSCRDLELGGAIDGENGLYSPISDVRIIKDLMVIDAVFGEVQRSVDDEERVDSK
jgi:hypothetical protein